MTGHVIQQIICYVRAGPERYTIRQNGFQVSTGQLYVYKKIGYRPGTQSLQAIWLSNYD